ncbi:hypothetical protein [Corynebacterium kalidii]
MKNPKPGALIIGFIVLVAIAVGIAWAVTSMIGGDEDDAARPATDSHTHIDPVADDPYVAATSTVSAILSYAPAEQDTVFDQYAAVRDRLTGQMAQLADNPPTGDDAARQTPPQWEAWAESGDRVRAIVERSPSTAPIEDGATEAEVTMDVRELIFHPDGETTPLRNPYVVTATVVVEDGIWKLQSYEITGFN